MFTYDFNRVHFFRHNDVYILMDINSDSIHRIDALTFHLLEALKENPSEEAALEKMIQAGYPANEVHEVFSEIRDLAEEGILFSSGEEISAFQPEENPIIKAMCLHIAHDCNLRCPYCFADQGPYGGDRSMMTAETGKAALELLFRESGTRKNLNIDFFGGEPLMNFPVVRELVLYAKSRAAELGKVLELTLTTNALLLDEEKGRFLKDQEISVVLSLDGRPEVHDRMRYTENHKPSYPLVMKNIQHFIADGYEKYIVRGTFTRENKDFLNDLLHLSEKGLKNLSLEPVVGPEEASYTIKEDDLADLRREYDRLADHMAGNQGDFNFFHFNVDIYKGPCLPKRISACGAGHEYLAVSPQGDLYPCHQFVGNRDFCVGNVREGFQRETGKILQQANVLHKEECMECWARFYCSGGCHASNYMETGSFLQVYKKGCELQKKRLECALYLVCKDADQGKE